MAPPHESNPNTNLWEKLGSNVIFNHHRSNRFKLVNICMVMVHGSVKGEYKFSNLVFIIKKTFEIDELLTLTLLSRCMGKPFVH
jgi:hypothetical protein